MAKSWISLALNLFLLGGISLRLAARDVQSNPPLADLQGALELNRRGDYGDALQRYQGFLSRGDVRLTPQLRAYVLDQMADAENGLGNYAQGEQKAREALRLLAAAKQENTSTYARAQGVLAQAMAGQGNYREARKMAEQAVSLGKETLGTHAPSFASLLTDLADALEDMGEHGRALKLFQQAAHTFEAAGQDYRVELGNAYYNLAGAFLDEGNAQKAIEFGALALAAWKPVLPARSLLVVHALSVEMLGYEKLKAYAQAEALVPEVVNTPDSQIGPHPQDRVILLVMAASVYTAEKKYERAAPLLKEAVELSEHSLPRGNPASGAALASYSQVLAAMGRTEEASRVRAESDVLLVFPTQSKLPEGH